MGTSELSRQQRAGRNLGSALLVLLCAACGSSSESSETEEPEAAPVETVTIPPEGDPSALVGEPTTYSLETLNTKASPEQLAKVASTPIDPSLSPEDAFAELANYQRAFGNGATLVPYDSALPETPESLAQGEQIWANLSALTVSPEFKANQFDIRAVTNVFFEGYLALAGKTVTLHDEWTLNDLQQTGEGTYEASFTRTWYTNIREFNDIAPKPADGFITNIDEFISGIDGVVTISNTSGQWLKSGLEYTE